MNKNDTILLEQAYTKISEHHGDEEFPEHILNMTVGELLDELGKDPVERELYADLEDWIAGIKPEGSRVGIIFPKRS